MPDLKRQDLATSFYPDHPVFLRIQAFVVAVFLFCFYFESVWFFPGLAMLLASSR